MADFYPLIAKAIARLDADAPGESRRALYERARTALTAQLRTTSPAFSEAEITREQLALEEALRRVEREAAQRARHARNPSSSNPVPSGGNLACGADDQPEASSLNETAVGAATMIVSGGATGRLIRIWRCSVPPKPRAPNSGAGSPARSMA
jgi:hypothetical protein